jgi:ABC-type multidrug transport system permease subunit
MGLGLAFRNKPPDIVPVAIVAGTGARDVLTSLKNGGGDERIEATIVSESKAAEGFRMAKYALVLRPLSDGSVEYRYDPAREETRLARRIVNDILQSGEGRSDPIATRSTQSTDPGSRYIDFLIPGLLGMNLLNSGLWGVGFTLVDVRQRKLLKRLVATPMRRTDYLFALTSSRLVFMVIEVVIFLGAGHFVFHMPILGSPLVIVSLCALGSITFSGLGLLAASRAQTSEAANGLINFITLPMWILSGVFFSYERFPAFMQPLIRCLPLTALIDALRATTLEASPIRHQAASVAVLLLWAGIAWMLGISLFRWT